MRLLVLSQLYPPKPATARRNLARALVERGHPVTAVTGCSDHPLGTIDLGYRQRMWAWDEDSGVRVLRLPLSPDHDRAASRRALCYLSVASSACFLGPILCGPANVTCARHPRPTTSTPARWISLPRRVRFVRGIQHMWPETLAATRMVRSGLVLSRLVWLGRLADSSTAAIVASSPGFKCSPGIKGVAGVASK